MRCLYFSVKIMTYLSGKFLIDPLSLEYSRTLLCYVDDYSEGRRDNRTGFVKCIRGMELGWKIAKRLLGTSTNFDGSISEIL